MIIRAYVAPDCVQRATCLLCGALATAAVRVYKDWGRPPYADTPTRFVYRMPCGHCPGVRSQHLTPDEIAVVALLLDEKP